jgi:hypothetical protein
VSTHDGFAQHGQARIVRERSFLPLSDPQSAPPRTQQQRPARI